MSSQTWLTQEAADRLRAELENDPGQIRNIVRDYIKVSDGVTPTGKSGQVLVDLKSTAMANGFDLNKIFTPQQIEGFLKKVDLGESVDTIKQQIRNIAKVGMPQNPKTPKPQNPIDFSRLFIVKLCRSSPKQIRKLISPRSRQTNFKS